jgi:hypothetical protein
MTWRGSTTVPDRIFASLPYLLPLIDGLVLGTFLFAQFPVLQVLLLPLRPVLIIYDSLGVFGKLIVFFALLLLVVRNEKISHFIRFNAMQAILLDIIIFLFGILTDVVGLIPAGSFAFQSLSTIIFIGVVAAVGYSVIQSVIGRYAEIPAVSDAVYMQVR